MFPSEYEVFEHRRDLLREAERRRFARQAVPSGSLTQRAGNGLLRLGAKLAAQDADNCYTIETRGQVVSICPA